MWGHPTNAGSLRARMCRRPLVSSHSAVLCAHRHIRQVPYQWNKSRDTSSPGNNNSVGRELRPRQVRPTPPRIWVVPRALRTPKPFFLPHTKAQKLPTQRKSLSRLTTPHQQKIKLASWTSDLSDTPDAKNRNSHSGCPGGASCVT